MRHLDDPGARVTEVPMRNSPEGEHMGRRTELNRRQQAAQAEKKKQDDPSFAASETSTSVKQAARNDLVTRGKGPQVIQQTDELQDVDQLGDKPTKSLDGLPLPCCRRIRHELPSLLA